MKDGLFIGVSHPSKIAFAIEFPTSACTTQPPLVRKLFKPGGAKPRVSVHPPPSPLLAGRGRQASDG